MRRNSGGNTFASMVDRAITDAKSQMNGLEFLESPQGPRLHLLPVQRVIFKATMGIPMDRLEGKVQVWDPFREKILYTLSDRDYLRYVADQGRCNFSDWRDLPPNGFNEIEIIAGRRGGKALGMDELIPTPEGWKLNRDLVAGDYVLGPDGVATKVLYAHEPFVAQAYRVSFDDGTSVVAHGGHLWWTETRSDRKAKSRRIPISQAKRPNQCASSAVGSLHTTEEIRSTLRIRRSDGKFETNHSIPTSKPVILPEVDLPLDPYFLGLWLGDGASRCPSITTMDHEVVDFLEEFAKRNGLMLRKGPESGSGLASTYHLTSGVMGAKKGSWGNGKGDKNPIKAILQSLDLIQNKHIPEAYLWASQEQRLALLQGLMDTDGGCHRSRCEFSSKSPLLAQGVYHLASSLGLKPNTTTGKTSLAGKRCSDRTRVTWTDPLPVFRIRRKLDALPKAVRTCQHRRFITAVDPVGLQEVRCITVEHPTGLFLFGKNFNVTHNSILISALAVEKLRQLLNVKNPHEIYRIVEGDFIDFTILAQDEDGAGRLYSRIRQAVNRAEFFRPFVFGKPGIDTMGLITEADRLRRDVQPSIMLTSWPCTTRSSRGPNSYFLALDEFAHFRSATGSSSDDVYEAASPSTARFIRREGAHEFLDSLTVIVTSPWTKVGKTYQLMSDAMAEGKDSSIFFFQCPSAEMAGTEISATYLRNKFRRDPVKWQAEYGGKFLESAGSFVPIADIDACVDKGRGNKCAFDPRNVGVTYFWGLDLGFKKDATAIAISHWEQDENGMFLLVYDYIDRMMVGEGVWAEAPELSVEAVLDWCWDLNQWFPGKYGSTDQYAGAMFIHLARQRQLEFFELVHLTEAINSEMYFALQGYIHQHVCRFPDVPKFRHELGTVEAFFVGKHRIRVEAPTEKNAHDDMCDAAALSAWRAQKWMLEEKAKGFAFSGEEIRQAGNKLRPGDLGINPEISPMSMVRVAERMRAMERTAAPIIPGTGGILLPPRIAARRGRF